MYGVEAACPSDEAEEVGEHFLIPQELSKLTRPPSACSDEFAAGVGVSRAVQEEMRYSFVGESATWAYR